MAALVLPLVAAFAVAGERSFVAADAVCDSVPERQRRVYRHTDAVKQLSIQRDTLAARKIWMELVEEDSTYSPALYYLSITEEKDGELRKEYARRAYKADSMNKWYTANYGYMLIEMGDYKEALAVERHLLSLDNRDYATYHALALLYSIQKMPYSAISILDSAELRLGRHPYLGAIKQRLLLDTHQYKRAIEEGEMLCEESPYSVENHLVLAQAYEASHRDSLAEATYLKAYAIDTTNLNTLLEVVDYYYRRDNASKMLEYEERLFKDSRVSESDKEEKLERYIGIRDFYFDNFFRVGNIILALTRDYPTNRNFMKAYAMHLIYSGARDEAYDYLVRHIDDSEATAEDYVFLIQFMLQLEKSDDEILQLLAKGKKRFGDDTSMIECESMYYILIEDYSKAIKILKRGVRSAKKLQDNKLRSKLLGYIGDLYIEQGKEMKSFMCYAEALHYDENNLPVLNNYAYYLSLSGHGLDKALAMSHLAMTLDSSNVTYIDTCAWVLHKLGRNDEAKKLMIKALSLDGQQDTDLLLHYGDILWALGEKFMAETYWKKAVDRGYDAELMEQHIKELKSEDVE